MLPKLSSEFIFSEADYVSINKENYEHLSQLIIQENCLSSANWSMHPLHPTVKHKSSISWIFFIDTINFSFWPDDDSVKYSVEYNGVNYTGYWSICAALNRAIDSGIDICSSEFMTKITEDTFREIFRSSSTSEIPLVKERVKALNEAGQVLLKKFNGHFSNCITDAKRNCVTLLRLITENFPSYRDEAVYKEQRVTLYKRAQILIADLWCCFEGKDWGQFDDIESLTAFADYRVPQVLAYFGAIEYSPSLQAVLDNKQQLVNGDPREVEIRGVSLHCIELMVTYMNSILVTKGQSRVNSVLLDNYLWDYRRKHATDLDRVAMHRTRTIFY